MCDVFESGELIRPVLASCCLPGIFEPMLLNKAGHFVQEWGDQVLAAALPNLI